jgi:hypothetical protein
MEVDVMDGAGVVVHDPPFLSYFTSIAKYDN